MKIKFVIFCMLVLLSKFALAQSNIDRGTYGLDVSIRATFMLHIVNYSRWDNPSNKQNFCLLEQDGGKYYQELVKDDFAKSAKVALNVVQINTLPEAYVQKCHYLFIDQANESDDIFQQLETANKQMVTIGESPQFVNQGGLMSLVSEYDRVKIYISRNKYKTSSVKFSARLLKFANFSG
ncbi:YfiR family protein [Aliiglaciecola litoralis]|uniref:YfiR family protein n=1 Tax=Aliiglaciecola litoralis TaxID=582857 RepID=A0ABP3WWQ1_9ALTE